MSITTSMLMVCEKRRVRALTSYKYCDDRLIESIIMSIALPCCVKSLSNSSSARLVGTDRLGTNDSTGLPTKYFSTAKRNSLLSIK